MKKAAKSCVAFVSQGSTVRKDEGFHCTVVDNLFVFCILRNKEREGRHLNGCLPF